MTKFVYTQQYSEELSCGGNCCAYQWREVMNGQENEHLAKRSRDV
eukprot:CCRYP_020158-RA/>CCRYP_020158-RA protein AED:0.00 eAED:0.00 QI:70/1/1/1/0/0/2/41/44